MDAKRSDTATCELCGGQVRLDCIVTVKIEEPDGSEVESQMTEGEARVLFGKFGLIQPPVVCDQHERMEVTTTRDAS